MGFIPHSLGHLQINLYSFRGLVDPRFIIWLYTLLRRLGILRVWWLQS